MKKVSLREIFKIHLSIAIETGFLETLKFCGGGVNCCFETGSHLCSLSELGTQYVD